MSKKTSIFNGISLVCGIIGAVCAFLCRMITPSPLDMIHKLDGLNVLPPIWIFNLLSVVWCFLMGAAAGIVIKDLTDGHLCGRSAISAYQGLVFFLVAFFLGIMWYPTFFAAQAVFISFIMCLVICVSSVCCAINWFSAGIKTAALIMAAYSIWSTYILVINLSVLFGI